MRRGLLFWLMLCCVPFFAVAQVVEETAPIDTAVYEYWKPRYYDSIAREGQLLGADTGSFEQMIPAYRNKEFDYIESISDKLSFVDTLIDRIGRFLDSLFPKPKGNYNQSFFDILAVLGGALVLFLLFKFILSRKKIIIHEPKEEGDIEDKVSFVEKNLLQVDIKPFIEEAVTNENYALAIRYQQLLNIQLLAEKGLIQWKQSKTNPELMEDVTDPGLRKEFLACASIFDYVWFGDFEMRKEDYERYTEQFNAFQRRWA